MIVATIVGLIATISLLLAGYIFGIRQGRFARENLKDQLAHSHNEINRLINTESKIDTLIEQNDSLNRTMEPSVEWELQLTKLDNAVKAIQSSVKNSTTSNGLTNLQTSATHRSNLTDLMDEIIEKAGFESVLLSDDQGLPLSGNTGIQNLDRLAAISAFALIFCDRFTRDGFVAPLSLMTHDPEHREMLCRVFYIGQQRFVLTAIAIDLMLTSDALEPTL